MFQPRMFSRTWANSTSKALSADWARSRESFQTPSSSMSLARSARERENSPSLLPACMMMEMASRTASPSAFPNMSRSSTLSPAKSSARLRRFLGPQFSWLANADPVAQDDFLQAIKNLCFCLGILCLVIGYQEYRKVAFKTGKAHGACNADSGFFLKARSCPSIPVSGTRVN